MSQKTNPLFWKNVNLSNITHSREEPKKEMAKPKTDMWLSTGDTEATKAQTSLLRMVGEGTPWMSMGYTECIDHLVR